MAHELATRRLGGLPVPHFSPESERLLAACARELTALAAARATLSNTDRLRHLLASAGADSELDAILHDPWIEHDRLRQRMVFLQDEIDWTVYAAVGLADTECVSTDLGYLATGRLARGQRECEQGLTTSLIRHRGTALSRAEAEVDTADIPELATVQARLFDTRRCAVRSRPELALVETRVYKRLWRDTEDNVPEAAYRAAVSRAALLDALLTQTEDSFKESLDVLPLSRTLATSRAWFVAALLRRLDLTNGTSLQSTLDDHAVPFLAQHRYTGAGLEVFREWQRTWERQRAEDLRLTDQTTLPVPPDYEPTHFRTGTYWRLRGKLDLPKERFISYPGCESDEDKEPVYGWAGWNHLQQAIALATLYIKRKQGEAWGKERLVPMLAGIDELLPWVWQWHAEPTAESGGLKPGQPIADFLAAQCHDLGVTDDELRSWRPPARGAKRVVAEEVVLHRPTFSAEQESTLLVLALVRSRPSDRITLARAFELLHQPTLLKKLVPVRLRGQAASWAKEVRGRKRKPGVFRATLDHLFASGALADGGSSSGRIVATGGSQAPTDWWVREAELGLAAADAMTDELAEALASKLPDADRHELRASA
jgi:hypothetical protein